VTIRVRAGCILLLLAPVLSSAVTGKLSEMPWACITVAGESHAVRLADSSRLRAAGFQHVPEKASEGEAIYFVYEQPQRPSFHMRNVSVPLSLAWIAPDERVLEVIRIQPDSSGHRPSERVRGVLELAPGHPLIGRIEAGVRISLPRRRADADARPGC
jgi:uncharacterized membrane protein (UPF0127 family)